MLGLMLVATRLKAESNMITGCDQIAILTVSLGLPARNLQLTVTIGVGHTLARAVDFSILSSVAQTHGSSLI